MKLSKAKIACSTNTVILSGAANELTSVILSGATHPGAPGCVVESKDLHF